ncbi:hypothetical protein ACIPY3_10700 [Paenarthrobacter sp. NPDC089714]|uniref:hypothetical protein n=1 Tax=Paenarthrobacter sp. NPDC089714 TaxID=3364377 RepID=UPI00380AEDE0
MRAGHPTAEHLPRITVEVPVLDVGAPLESLGRYVDSVRKPEGLHMTLLHVGILDRLAADIVAWTGGVASTDFVIREVSSWLRGLPVLDGFLGKSAKLVTLGGGRVSSLEVEVPQAVHDYQTLLVQGLHVLLDDLGLDNIDDFILSSPALGYRSPRWIPHVAVGRARSKHQEPLELETVALEFGSSRIRNEASLPSVV